MTRINARPDITVAVAVEAYKTHGSVLKAAEALGCDRGMLARRLRANTTTEHMPPPDGQLVRGVSTLYDADGNVAAQWVKTSLDDEAQLAAQRAAYKALADKLPRVAPAKAPKTTLAHLLNLYVITDAHIGMYAWHEETGHDWDLAIAERVIWGAFAHMITSSPPARVGVVCNLGDFVHTDGFKALTPNSGHLLDADSRYQKMIRVAIRLQRRAVDLALQRHEVVHFLAADANHDPVGGAWTREMFAALYEHEPRVIVDRSPSPYLALRHGKTMLAFHHGHGAKKAALPLLFATRCAEMWGATEHRYVHTGHLHHVDEKEHPGMTVIQHPTLTAPDAYSARGGWDSKRAARAITYHSTHGEVGRSVVTPEMLEAA